MPAHTPKNQNPEIISALQIFWRYFITKDFKLYPTSHSLPTRPNLPESYLLLQPQILAYEPLTDLKQAIQTMEGLYATAIKTDPKLTAQWSYLGQNNERSSYIKYIDEFFWQHQHLESLLLHPDYNQMLESPWKILTYANDLDLSPRIPTDFFNPQSLEFTEQLHKALSNWEFQPFLLLNPTGSLQWRIFYQNILLLDGCIYKQQNQLRQQIQLQPLVPCIL